MDIRKIKECRECASRDIRHVVSKEQIICSACGDIFEPTIDDIKRAEKHK
ncbi:hypothetical protein HY486_04220 [Candidatus Woesearchaeota archaeon]|nr:hypothetical protein [Candidatus Woesearchaeota archaeon]